MRATGLKVISFPDNRTVVNYNGSYDRIRIGVPFSLAGQVQAPLHEFYIITCRHSPESVIFDIWVSIYEQ
jgi:hypothetical protein